MRPKPPPRPYIVVALLALLAALGAPPALAQGDADRAAAQSLFEEGKQLKDAGDFEPACKKFQASQKLDPAVGTQLNLADCYERIGKTASAWVNFVEVSENKEAGKRRAQFAAERAEKLRPRLTRLVVEVAAPARGLSIERGDVEIARETWGTPVPIDPGSYEITARAPGKLPWRETIDVEGEGETITVKVPALVDESIGAPGDSEAIEMDQAPSGDEADDGSGQRIAGGVLLGLGGAGLVAGAVLAGLAHSKADESKDNCLPQDPNQCTRQEDVDLREEAQALQVGYVISFAAGGALAIAGLVTLLTAPDGKEAASDDVSFELGPSFVGIRGRF